MALKNDFCHCQPHAQLHTRPSSFFTSTLAEIFYYEDFSFVRWKMRKSFKAFDCVRESFRYWENSFGVILRSRDERVVILSDIGEEDGTKR